MLPRKQIRNMSLNSRLITLFYSCPQGLPTPVCTPVDEAATSLVGLLYNSPYQVSKPHNISDPKRNSEIRARYAQGGWSIPKLAREYGISNARVHQILKQESQTGKN
jgi:hypothetical protein